MHRNNNKNSTFRDRVIKTMKTPSPSITFIMKSGGVRYQNLNPQFFIDKRGKTKTPNQIEEDLKAIAFDLGAKKIIL